MLMNTVAQALLQSMAAQVENCLTLIVRSYSSTLKTHKRVPLLPLFVGQFPRLTETPKGPFRVKLPEIASLCLQGRM